jgi:multiple sugar transport system ATP-binding protein
MARIRMHKLTKHFGNVNAVQDLDLEVPNGSFVALLGPSGCGKTTTMNMIAGLDRPTRGEIYFDDQPMSGVEPGRRGIGFVFQNYAIFTHMTVRHNLAFGLLVRRPRPSAGSIDAEVQRISRLMGLQPLLDTRAGRLSVNDMQRVALGRSMIVQPEILLLDEPLSNLDAAFRAVMRAELKRIQHEAGQTTLYVTHDQLEAMSMANLIAIMDRGRLQQYGTPEDVYERPANRFVARFVGSVPINLLSCVYEPTTDRAMVRVIDGSGGSVDVTSRRTAIEHRVREGGRLVLAARPERVQLVNADAPEAVVRAAVTLVEPLGPRDVVHLEHHGTNLRVLVHPDRRPAVGTNLGLVLEDGAVHLFDERTGEAIR